MQIIDGTAKDLEYCRNSVDKAVEGFERTDSHFESSSVGKMLSTALHATQKSSTKAELADEAHFSVVLRKCHSHLKLQQPLISQQSSTQTRPSTMTH